MNKHKRQSEKEQEKSALLAAQIPFLDLSLHPEEGDEPLLTQQQINSFEKSEGKNTLGLDSQPKKTLSKSQQQQVAAGKDAKSDASMKSASGGLANSGMGSESGEHRMIVEE